MITKCQALIFDVDGTLPETDDLHRKAFNQTFQKWYLGWHWDFKIYKQLSEVSGGKEKLNYYTTLSQTKGIILTQQQIGERHYDKTQLYSKSLVEKPSTLLPEVKTIIKEAQYKSIRQAVATANKFENVKW